MTSYDLVQAGSVQQKLAFEAPPARFVAFAVSSCYTVATGIERILERDARVPIDVVMSIQRLMTKEYEDVPGGRILVIDDDRMVRDAVGTFLEQEGYEVECSPNGVDAINKVSLRTPDVIILDLMMPGMNGREFITALREQLGLTSIPVLVMTALHGISQSQAVALGASDVVEKPFDIDDILNKVALAMFRTRSTLGSTTAQTSPQSAIDEAFAAARSAARDLDDDDVASPQDDGVVLIVDPDRSTWRHLTSLLGDRGYKVVSMARVSEDLHRLARVLEPQAILLSLHLPDNDSLATLRRLRRDRALDGVPIFLVSSDRRALEEVRTTIAGLAAELLPKSIKDEELVSFITAPPRTAWRSASML